MIQLTLTVEKTEGKTPNFNIKTNRAVIDSTSLEEVMVYTYLEEQIKPIVERMNNEWDGSLPYKILSKANVLINQAVKALEKEKAKDTPDDTNKRADTDTKEKQG